MASIHHRRTVKPARLTKESLRQLLELATKDLDPAETHDVSVELEVESGDAKINAENINDLFSEMRPFSDLKAVEILVRSWRRTPYVREKRLRVRLGQSGNEVSSESINADWASATTNRLADFIDARRPWYWRFAGMGTAMLPLLGSIVVVIAGIIAANYGNALMTRMFFVVWVALVLLTFLLILLNEELVPRFKVYLDQSGRSDNLSTIGIAVAVIGLIVAPFVSMLL